MARDVMLRVMVLGSICGLLSAQAAAAAEWHCRNKDMEISCEANQCKGTEHFTPLDIFADSHGRMSICAYSGCWEGAGQVFSAGSHLLFSAHRLKWTGSASGSGDDAGTDFILGIDAADGVAVLKGAGYAMPLLCAKVRLPKK